jgi:hypothetical protein
MQSAKGGAFCPFLLGHENLEQLLKSERVAHLTHLHGSARVGFAPAGGSERGFDVHRLAEPARHVLALPDAFGARWEMGRPSGSGHFATRHLI